MVRGLHERATSPACKTCSLDGALQNIPKRRPSSLKMMLFWDLMLERTWYQEMVPLQDGAAAEGQKSQTFCVDSRLAGASMQLMVYTMKSKIWRRYSAS